MIEIKDNNITQELLKEKIRGVAKSWRADETFSADSTARQYGYLPVDMGANIRDLEARVYKLLCEFKDATKTDINYISLKYDSAWGTPKLSGITISVKAEE